jgi:hypothetical protein
MSHYTYRCSTCGEETVDEMAIGTARRMKKCECGRPARLVIGEGVYIAAAARPNTHGNVIALNAREDRFEKDGPAYQRMRWRGLQPDHIDGAARLENEVGDQDDIDYARAIKVAKKVGGGKERVVETIDSLVGLREPLKDSDG